MSQKELWHFQRQVRYYKDAKSVAEIIGNIGSLALSLVSHVIFGEVVSLWNCYILSSC